MECLIKVRTVRRSSPDSITREVLLFRSKKKKKHNRSLMCLWFEITGRGVWRTFFEVDKFARNRAGRKRRGEIEKNRWNSGW